jgi:hypothetical protein
MTSMIAKKLRTFPRISIFGRLEHPVNHAISEPFIRMDVASF